MKDSNKIEGPLDDVFVNKEEYEQEENQNKTKKDGSKEFSRDEVFEYSVKNMDEEKKQRMIKEKLAIPSTEGFARIKREKSVKHKDNCKALKHVEDGSWDSPWTFATGEKFKIQEEEWKPELKVKFDSKAKYIVLKCQDRECDAKIFVETDDLLRLIPILSKQNEGSQ